MTDVTANRSNFIRVMQLCEGTHLIAYVIWGVSLRSKLASTTGYG